MIECTDEMSNTDRVALNNMKSIRTCKPFVTDFDCSIDGSSDKRNSPWTMDVYTDLVHGDVVWELDLSGTFGQATAKYGEHVTAVF